MEILEDDKLRNAAPSLLLLGMRSAGKTTLGRLAAEHLKGTFVDADDVFTEEHKATPKEFVAQNGWDAFRNEESLILQSLLKRARRASSDFSHPRVVVSLGGGIVDRPENRKLLVESWSRDDQSGHLDTSKMIAAVHVFREVEMAVLDKRGLPNWNASDANVVWHRRRPWFRMSCTFLVSDGANSFVLTIL